MTSETIVLLASAFFTSIISGTIGMGGGILLIAVMAQYFPLAVLIPLHGLVQLGSNSSRAVYHFRNINRKIVGLYAVGAMSGAALGSRFILHIPEGWYKLGLGIFIFVITFVNIPKLSSNFNLKWPLLGASATFLSLMVGATGPLIAPFYLSENLERHEIIATKATCQLFTHLFKVITFFFLGFVIGPYLFLLIGMIAMVIVGNYIGKLILHRTPERLFLFVFKLLILILSGRMIWTGARILGF